MILKKLRSSFLFLAFSGLVLSGCAVAPNEADSGPDLQPLPSNEQEKFINKIVETKYLSAALDVNIAYKGEDMEKADNYNVTGNALLDIQNLDNVGADVDLTLDMNNTPSEGLPLINVDFVYKESTVYLDVNGRAVKLETDDFGELIELVLGSDSDPTPTSEQTNITNSGIKEIVSNIANMVVTNEGDHYKYVAQTTGDQPELVLTSDLDYNITSLAIAGIKYQDFTIDVRVNTEVKTSIDNPIVSPETAGHPYINLTNYFGTLRKFRAILDDEEFGMDYELALTHYEPKTPDQRIYLGDTTGHMDMDLASSTVDLAGAINISDIRTDDHLAYTTNYHAQYLDKSIYLDYLLSDDSHYMLTFSNQGLQDMWELMGDEEVFGINLFDLLFGTSDKEYPIIDILTDATYRYLAKYGEINLAQDYIEVEVDNTLFGGLGYGSIKIVLNDDRSISHVSITSLDINSYIVDGFLAFKDYKSITPVTPSNFHSLDGLDSLIRDGAAYFRSNKYNLGLDLDITDTLNSKAFSLDGTAQVNIHQKSVDDPTVKTGYDANANLVVNDFNNHLHTFELNATPEEQDVYAKYTFKEIATSTDDPIELKLRASRTSISSLFDELTGYEEDDQGEGQVDIMTMIAPYIVGATKDTLHRILKEGDYFAVLRDETIKSITMVNDVYTIVLDKSCFGFEQDIELVVAMKTVEEEGEEVSRIDYLQIFTQYDRYVVNLRVTLNNNKAPILPITDKEGYIPVDNLTDIFMNKEAHLTVNADIDKVLSSDPLNPKEYISVSDCVIDAKINAKASEDQDLWDRLYAQISGNVLTSGDSQPTNFVLGYDSNLSIKFGDDAMVSVSRSQVKDILNRAKNVLPKSEVVTEEVVTDPEEKPLEKDIEGNVNLFLQVMEILAEGKYSEFLAKVKSTALEEGDPGEPNVLAITIDNSMLREGDETEGTIRFTFDTTGIHAINISNVRYDNFALTGSLSLQNRNMPEDIDVTPYNKVYNIVDAVLNTASTQDVVLDGSIKLKAAAGAINKTFPTKIFVTKKLDEHNNESVYGYMRIDNISFFTAGINFSDNRDTWTDSKRCFELFLSSEVNYDEHGHTILDEEGNVTRTSYAGLRVIYEHNPWGANNDYRKVKEKVIPLDDLTGDLTYYLLNFGFGLKARSESYPTDYPEDTFPGNKDDDWINFHNYNIEDNYTPNLSTLLKEYEWYNPEDYSGGTMTYTSEIFSDMKCTTSNEAWRARIDGGNLINNDLIKDVEFFTHTGVSGQTTYLKKVIVTTEIVYFSIVTIDIGIDLTNDYGASAEFVLVDREVKGFDNSPTADMHVNAEYVKNYIHEFLEEHPDGRYYHKVLVG